MTLKPLKPPRPLKPFRSFLPDRFRRKRQAARLPGKLNEETMQGIIKGGSSNRDWEQSHRRRTRCSNRRFR